MESEDPTRRSTRTGFFRPRSDRWFARRSSAWLPIFAAALLIAPCCWSYFHGGIVASLLRADLSAEDKLTLLHTQFAAWGPAGPAIYAALVTVEVVVAPIPGTMLYAPGGVLFGGFWGGLGALVGNVLGAGIACQLMRSLGREWAATWLAGERAAKLQSTLERRGLWIVFLLRVNPLTSSDLVSYAAGLTRMPAWKVMLGTALGMAPLCFAQACLAASLLDALPSLVYPLLAACAAYAACVVWVIRKLIRGNSVRLDQGGAAPQQALETGA